MKTIIAVLILLSGLLATTSASAGDSQRVAIDRKWKAAQESKEKSDRRLESVERDMEAPFGEADEPKRSGHPSRSSGSRSTR